MQIKKLLQFYEPKSYSDFRIPVEVAIIQIDLLDQADKTPWLFFRETVVEYPDQGEGQV